MTALDRPQFAEPARCAEVDPERWFPEKGGDMGRAAKWVCGRCEARVECLEWALDNDERYGIYGGLSGQQRRRLRATRAAA